MDHVSVVVDGLEAAKAYFVVLGMELDGEAPIEGPWIDRVMGNTQGLRSVMFTVDDIDATVARLQAHGAEIVGEVAQYQDSYRLCYVRGPEGIIVAPAEVLSG